MSDDEYDYPEQGSDDDDYNRHSALAGIGKPVAERQEIAKMTKKVPPYFDGRMSWFSFEDMLQDWIEMTDEKPEKHGILVKQRLIGDAEHFRALLDNEKLKDPENGVKYLKDIIRPNYVKGSQQLFLWRFLQLIGMRRPKGVELLLWIPRVQVKKKRALAAWMDCYVGIHSKTSMRYRSWVARENSSQGTASAGADDDEYEDAEEGRGARETPAAPAAKASASRPSRSGDDEPTGPTPLDPEEDSTLEMYNDFLREKHKAKFPLSDNMISLLFIVSSELNETQRERLIGTLTLKELNIEQYTTTIVEGVFRELFASARTGFADPFVLDKRRQMKRSYIILDQGDWEGSLGYWVQDEESLEEGFYDVEEQIFWTYKEEQDAWFSNKKGGKLKRGNFKKRQRQKERKIKI